MENSYNFKIEGNSRQDTDKIANALNILYKHINDKDLVYVAEKIKEDPTIIAKVVKLSSNPIVRKLW